MREKEGLAQVFITEALRAAGVDPDREVAKAGAKYLTKTG